MAAKEDKARETPLGWTPLVQKHSETSAKCLPRVPPRLLPPLLAFKWLSAKLRPLLKTQAAYKDDLIDNISLYLEKVFSFFCLYNFFEYL